MAEWELGRNSEKYVIDKIMHYIDEIIKTLKFC